MQATLCDCLAEVFRLGVICFSEPATRADKQQRWLMKKVKLYRRDLHQSPAVGQQSFLSPSVTLLLVPMLFWSSAEMASLQRLQSILCLLTPVKCCCKEVMAASTQAVSRPPRLRAACPYSARNVSDAGNLLADQRLGSSLPPIRSTTGAGFRVVSGSAMKSFISLVTSRRMISASSLFSGSRLAGLTARRRC
jgi:hypothetical protein